jgi:hypothetical protein
VDCARGSYSGNAATSCTECSEGFYADEEGLSSCKACPSGTFASLEASWNCTSCRKGYYQGSTSQSKCERCEAGKFAAVEQTSSCTACSAGSYSSTTASWNCTECPAGKYQGSTGLSECFDCDAGKKASQKGTTSCSSCDLEYTNLKGSGHCNHASSGYYLSYPNKSSILCPAHTTCNGAVYLPIPDYGYWVNHDQYSYAGDIYQCSRDTCKGGAGINLSCWELDKFDEDDEQCDINTLQCRDGSEGPLCGACSDGFVFRGNANACVACEGAQSESIVICICVGVLMTIIFVIYKKRDSLKTSKISALQFLLHIDSGSLKVRAFFFLSQHF